MNRAIVEARQNTRYQADSIAGDIARVGEDALYLSGLRSLGLLRSLWEEDAAPEQIELWQSEAIQDLLVFASVRPMVQLIRFVDNDGVELVAVESDADRVRSRPLSSNAALLPYIRELLDLSPGADVLATLIAPQGPGQDDAGDVMSIYYARRLVDGVIMVHVHPDWLLRNLPSDDPTSTWTLRFGPEVALDYPPTSDADGLGIMSEDTDIDANLPSGVLEAENDIYVFATLDSDGTYANVPWILFQRNPKSVLYVDQGQYYQTFGVFLLGSVISATALALWASDRFSVPITKLRRMVETFRYTGKSPIPPHSRQLDEIGQLTLAFCDLATELEAKRSAERALIEKLISAQEEERKRVAYDLHDGLIQQLVGARFYLSRCLENGNFNNKAERKHALVQGSDALTDAIVEGRRMIQGLHPTVLDDLGLVDAIADLAQSCADIGGWVLHMDLRPLPVLPDKSTSVTLYRITQEALNNITKHASADHVSVSLRYQDGIFLTIEDDGRGFDFEQIRNTERGWGVTTMKERAKLINGGCTVESAPKVGTTVSVWVPSRKEFAEANE